jgi:hypothetical protein
MQTVIISGSSITEDSPWPTWATWSTKIFNWRNVVNVSVRGLGNEVILLKALQAAEQSPGKKFIIVQLTSVDKWDWYVQNSDRVAELDKEKHPIVKLNASDAFGYWSTGSHFPNRKEHYRNEYFSIDHQCFHTLQLISWFQLVCKQRGWDYHILFDSPIFAVTESQLNTGILDKSQCENLSLLGSSLSKLAQSTVDTTDMYLPGLIGYCCLNNLPWYHTKYKGHPGSLAHLEFTINQVVPVIEKYFKVIVPPDQLLTEATKMQLLVNEIP